MKWASRWDMGATSKEVAAILIAAFLCVFVGVSAVDAQSQQVCYWTDHPGVYPAVTIQITTGRQFTFQKVTEETVKSWDSNRLVIGGGQTRIPYDNIVVLDARCA